MPAKKTTTKKKTVTRTTGGANNKTTTNKVVAHKKQQSGGNGGVKSKKATTKKATPSNTNLSNTSASRTTTKKKGGSGSHRATSGAGSGGGSGSTHNGGVSKTLILVWILVALELTLDLVTTIISFIALLKDTKCCDEVIDMGRWPLVIILPFLCLVLIELAMLVQSIKLSMFGEKQNFNNGQNQSRRGFFPMLWSLLLPGGKSSFQYGTGWFRLINVLVLLNPFFGFLVAWMLLYQSSKVECFVVLGLEGASILLHWSSLYLEGAPQTKWTLAVHAIPLLPFTITVIVILLYLQLGGVCYLVEDAIFWYDGCQICPDKSLPDPNNSNNRCPGDDVTISGDYCGDDGDTKFCFFNY